MDVLTSEILVLLFVTALAAGLIDAIAGGGGLLVLPVLLFTGVPPVQALATNKLQGTFGTLSATLTFVHSGHLCLRKMGLVILMTAVGAALGAWLAQIIDADLLRQIIPFMLISIALYYSLSPNVGSVDTDEKIGNNAFALSAAQGVGFYDGFFGPGTGTFFTTSYVILRGYNLLKATAHAKILNLVSNLISLIVFIIGGQVLWQVGLFMGVGQIIGASLGSRLIIKRGTRWIRPILIIVSLLITFSLLIKDDSHFIHEWFVATF